jgi:uncharacterized membrane protein
MAQRFPKPGRRILIIAEAVALGIGISLALVAGLVLINPWWGLAPAPVPSWMGVSIILPAYAAPALILLLYGYLRGKSGAETRASVARAAGLTLLFAAIILELRRTYHGARMADAPILPVEAWTYNAAAFGLAALMFALSAERQGKLLRYASLGLALLTLAKAAIFDLGGLEGAARLAAFVGLIGAGGALIWLYRRLALPGGAAQPTNEYLKPDLPKPNLVKPEPAKSLAETPPG